MPTKLSPKLKKKLQALELNRHRCSVSHCYTKATGKWKGSYVCDDHYEACWDRYMKSWVVFIADITQEVLMKMTMTEDERCIVDPPSCLKTPKFDMLVNKVSGHIINSYIPGWATKIITKTLVKRGVKMGLLKM